MWSVVVSQETTTRPLPRRPSAAGTGERGSVVCVAIEFLRVHYAEGGREGTHAVARAVGTLVPDRRYVR
ncbi:hypothetical protein GCM10018777_07000 [Streptomyces albogriseolus]|nr:hypothetical protein GCM10018777_07000 [Streptomyces viridodiastaticus]